MSASVTAADVLLILPSSARDWSASRSGPGRLTEIGRARGTPG
jgi:hypothetical protein